MLQGHNSKEVARNMEQKGMRTRVLWVEQKEYRS
jgi:hypothetical protein